MPFQQRLEQLDGSLCTLLIDMGAIVTNRKDSGFAILVVDAVLIPGETQVGNRQLTRSSERTLTHFRETEHGRRVLGRCSKEPQASPLASTESFREP